MIRNDADLQNVVARVGRDLEDIQNYLGNNDHDAARIRFPRGYLREAASFRRRLWFIRNETLRRNLAYAFILSDLFRWLMNRTDLQWSALEMVVKEGICLWGAVSESITKEVATAEQICGNRAGFKRRCDLLLNNNYITEITRDEMHWLWDTRQNEHIFLVPDREHQMYRRRDYNRAVRSVQRLTGDLEQYFTW